MRLQYAREDMLEVLVTLPVPVLDWLPSIAPVSPDAWAPEVRTIREIVAHVLQLGVYYRDALRDGPASGIFEQVSDAAHELELTQVVLRGVDRRERSRVFRPVRPGRSVPEEWTIRKVVRRQIAHERVHTAEIQQRLAWLLLGLPARSED